VGNKDMVGDSQRR